MPIRIGALDYNVATEDELAAHGLDLDDALDVYEGPAKYFPQDAKDRLDDDARLVQQPVRLLMIGPDASGRLLTFVLELPDADRICHVVTGYPSAQQDRTRCHQPGGRMRR